MAFSQTTGHRSADRMSGPKKQESLPSHMTTAHRSKGPVPGLAVIVMAAGLGKRMQSKHAKVLQPIAGRAMVLYSVELGLRAAGIRMVVVVGHQADRVGQVIKEATAGNNGHTPLSIVEQQELLGTGDGVLRGRPQLSGYGYACPGPKTSGKGE